MSAVGVYPLPMRPKGRGTLSTYHIPWVYVTVPLRMREEDAQPVLKNNEERVDWRMEKRASGFFLFFPLLLFPHSFFVMVLPKTVEVPLYRDHRCDICCPIIREAISSNAKSAKCDISDRAFGWQKKRFLFSKRSARQQRDDCATYISPHMGRAIGRNCCNRRRREKKDTKGRVEGREIEGGIRLRRIPNRYGVDRKRFALNEIGKYA